jgi:hypothetical protein
MSDVPIKEYVNELFRQQEKHIERSLQALNEARHRRDSLASLLLSAAVLVMAIATLILAFYKK